MTRRGLLSLLGLAPAIPAAAALAATNFHPVTEVVKWTKKGKIAGSAPSLTPVGSLHQPLTLSPKSFADGAVKIGQSGADFGRRFKRCPGVLGGLPGHRPSLVSQNVALSQRGGQGEYEQLVSFVNRSELLKQSGESFFINHGGPSRIGSGSDSHLNPTLNDERAAMTLAGARP